MGFLMIDTNVEYPHCAKKVLLQVFHNPIERISDLVFSILKFEMRFSITLGYVSTYNI